jgi:hypothetical protein
MPWWLIFLPGISFCGADDWRICPIFDPNLTPQHQWLHWSSNHPYTRPGLHIIWAKPLLPVTPVKKMKVKWLMICYLSIILSVPIRWVCAQCPEAFRCDHSGSEFPLMITHKSVDHCLGFWLSYSMYRWKSHDNLHAAVGVILIAPVMARLSDLCSLILLNIS